MVKRKLSKRKDPECAMKFYHEEGIPTEAVKLYLMTLANTNFEQWMDANKDKTIDDFEFSFNKISKSGGLFDMEKLTRQQEYVICKLLHYSKSEEFSQFILKTIGEHNWTRNILSDTVEFLTEEQEDLYESLGGGYDSEEIDEFIYNNNVNLEISRKLREQGVTKYLCENEDYLDEIRNGSIICEGINVEEIKNMVME